MTTPNPPSKTAPRFPKKTPVADQGKTAGELIDARIASLPDWRSELLARLRSIILAADPAIVEEWKWNVPVWSCSGILCTGETYKKAVKLTFPKGGYLADPAHLFNASLEGNARRAIDFAEGAAIDAAINAAINEQALTDLLRAAIQANQKTGKPQAKNTA